MALLYLTMQSGERTPTYVWFISRNSHIDSSHFVARTLNYSYDQPADSGCTVPSITLTVNINVGARDGASCIARQFSWQRAGLRRHLSSISIWLRGASCNQWILGGSPREERHQTSSAVAEKLRISLYMVQNCNCQHLALLMLHTDRYNNGYNFF